MDIALLTPNDEFTPGGSWSGHDWLDGSTSPEEQFLDNKKQSRTLTPNLTRRSHKKSRNGCFSCKTRKIKCDESKPLCTQCKLKSVECQYPTAPPRRELSNSIRRPNQPLASSPMAAQFTLNDMQFFHHFLTISFPHLPLGNEDVWVRDIPQFAQSYTYLMHAILALGASHLNRLTPQCGYAKEALMHRGHAINGLNTCMAKSQHAYGEADAMLATCYALTFQASYMADGIADFVIFVRGCALATGKIRDENAQTAFNLAPDRHHQVIRPRLQSLPQLNTIHVANGLSALDEVQVYLHHEAEHKFYASLRDVFTALHQSPAAGYLMFVNMYRVWYDLDHDTFKVFLDSSNTTIQILLAFFIGIQMIMAPLTAHEWPERTGLSNSGVETPGETLGISSAGGQSLLGMADWMESVASKVPEELQWHLAWSRNLVGTVIAELSGLPYSGPPVLYVGRKESLHDASVNMSPATSET
ncbi:hypothetical protein PMZ80_007414 [Knufia obscura]|uniref:Zn(2)-C6 fungal-type domain-containing protein n=2 Tax=Knufia TaxID=430999 RepID=A0AAN8EFT0_9EURO|nr:hypothetical protein PMZ80_007414 [Knufia obscura]KAK5950498.1 hypothetical protein OHC33_008441 [Knufia fluminis]